MSKAIKYQHKLPSGRIVTRRSPRPYTHVIIGEYVPRLITDSKGERNNYQFHCAVIKAGIGNRIPGSVYTSPVDEQLIRRAHEVLDDLTEEQYVAREVARRNEHEQTHAGWYVLQWSMSKRAADAKVGHWAKYYRNVRVEEIAP